MVGLLLFQQTLDFAGTAFQEQTLSLLQKFITYGGKKFYNIGPWSQFNITFSSLINKSL
jgi:hypothetical protein